MARKSFEEKLRDSKDMPKIERITDPRLVARYGGERLLIAPPLEYDELMRRVPRGGLTTVNALREALAKRHSADSTCPLTAGIFINICAFASAERAGGETPYWRTLKSGGELNEKYPGGIADQRRRLESEGHEVTQKGKRFFVADYKKSLVGPAELGKTP